MIREQFDDIVNEVKALNFFYRIADEQLCASINAFEVLWEDTNSTTDQLQEAVNVIEARIEDVCLAHGVVQEQLEELMENNPSYTNHPIDPN